MALATSCTPDILGGRISKRRGVEEGYYFGGTGTFRWERRVNGAATIGEGSYERVGKREIKLNFDDCPRKLHLMNMETTPKAGETTIDLHAIFSNGSPVLELKLIVDGDTVATTDSRGYARAILRNDKVRHRLDFALPGYRTRGFLIDGGDTAFFLTYEADVSARLRQHEHTTIRCVGNPWMLWIIDKGKRKRYHIPRHFDYWYDAY